MHLQQPQRMGGEDGIQPGMDAKGLVAALRQSEERYRLLVERLPGIVYID